jgi:ubiquinone/menaquinone biosynthesis C-methylase UbiE
MAHELYNQLSRYIDASYRRTKNYQQEVDFILRRAGNIPGRKILIDVACGSGGHAELLSEAGFDVYAVDLNASMLRLLKKNLPNAKVYRQDMRELHVPVQADVLICMYNSINYNYSYAELSRTLKRFYDHLKPGGDVVFDTAFMEHTWTPGPFSVETITTPEFEVARINKSYKKGSFGIVEIVFVVFEKGRKKIIETRNKIFLPDRERILKLMEQAGFKSKLYCDFSDTKPSGTVCVFVGRKQP